jgi:hypothetical protein
MYTVLLFFVETCRDANYTNRDISPLAVEKKEREKEGKTESTERNTVKFI